MRILHVIPGLDRTHGGPTYALHAMVAAIADQGYDVHVIATRSKSEGPAERIEVGDARVKYSYFPRRMPKRWSFSWQLRGWVREHVSEFDVLHVHALFAYPTLVACAMARRRGVPYVLRPLGTLDPWALSYRRWKKAPYFRLIERRNLSGAAAIHATTPLEESAIRALDLSASVVTIPLGVEIGEPMERSPDRAGDEPVRVLYLSRLHPIKGLDVLVEALARVQNPAQIRVTLAGGGEARYVRQLKDSVKRRGLAERVHFAGFVTGDEKAQLLESADIFVLPSYSENFGVAVAEAMAAAVPVVVSDRVGLASAVEQAGAGLVVPTEARALAGALEQLVNDPDRRRCMGAAGRAYVEKELTWPKVARQLVELYEDIVRSHSR